MRALNDLIIRVSHSAWLFILSAIFAFGSLGFVFMNIDVAYQAIVGAPIFDLQNSLSVEQIFEQLKSVDESARSLYFAFAFVDFYFPFFAGLVMAAAGAFALRNLSDNWYGKCADRKLFAILLLPTVFDWLENIFALTVINSYPTELTTAANLLVLAKSAKLASIFLMQGIVGLLLLGAALRWIGQRTGLVR